MIQERVCLLIKSKNGKKKFSKNLSFKNCQSNFYCNSISVCQLIERDVIAVIGVNLKSLDKQVASILNYFGIPFLQINPSLGWDNEQTLYNSSVNLYPSRKILSQASVTSVVELEGIDIREHSLIFNYVDKISAFFGYFPTQGWYLWRNSFTAVRENLHTVVISSTTYLLTYLVLST